MNDAKYIGMDVHQATICAAVRDSGGNLVMEATLETKAETILEFVHGLRGNTRKRRRQLIGIANVCRLSEGRQGQIDIQVGHNRLIGLVRRNSGILPFKLGITTTLQIRA